MSLPPNSPRTRSSSSSSYASSITSTSTSTGVSSAPGSRSENVHVAVRVRPPSASELSKPGSDIWETDTVLGKLSLNAEYAAKQKKQTPEYTYDAVLIGSDNRLLYERCVREVVRSTMEGYNGTVFAYGQTASGKTYDLLGGALDNDRFVGSVDSQPGVIPQAVEDVFHYIKETAGNREFLLRVSYMEIYNETIRDLLSPEVTDLRIHEDKRRGVYVSPLREEIVTSPKQVMKVIQRGEANRHISATDYNEHSSRSHTIFQMVIESRDPRSAAGRMTPVSRRFASGKSSLGGGVKISLLNLIDLAGSEKASSSVDRRKESAYINKSLLTLGNVISKLTEDKRVISGHIPYRDSKLTRILQSALSGNSRVAVTCTISPSGINLEESNNTLKFAAKVKKVVTRAETTQVMDDKALLQKYKMEIMELKAKLMHTNEAFIKDKEAELSQLKEEKRKYEEDLMEAQLARTSLKERIDHLTKLILTSNSISPKVLLDRTKRHYRPTSVNFGLSNMAVNEVDKLEQELGQKNNTIKTLIASISCKDDYITEVETLIKSLGTMEIVEKFQALPKPDDQGVRSAAKEGQEEEGQEVLRLQKLVQEFEKVTDQQETKITSLEEQLKSLKENAELEFTTTEEYQEMSRELEEQRQVITELEEEVKDNKNLIAELRNVIRKMELSLFEKAEVSSASGKGNGLHVGSSEEVAKGRTTSESARIKELEQQLEKERKLRLDEQNASTERIAELEAELTISQAELSVAQLISGFSGKSSS
ncbi:kinesin-domain-containing protein [Basidiobolus meristosporus CBS 931.73]|uniref:Kinesin-domain-containing protein n=1 Tax=Basidiobolus meristosporus CBS 931.73 TaxID=1314790 RepID=A0A1Y1XB07_9FUNG|nr:kinesin-domain-containing protein [Basidiobolus meristosporus CBS 931.73]|eukprot:ORX82903.1 kinesin-domain-containing protein [Basidiobolus meristosporus CBS 931.73]